jgi:hypothetical protein
MKRHGADEMVKMQVPRYTAKWGFIFKWEDGFNVNVNVIDNAVLVKANKQGLISLARHLLELSQSDVPAGIHIHLDESNSLSDGSKELVVEKM